MKILSASQVKQADNYTIAHEPVSSIDLMERASNAFTDCFTDLFPGASTIWVFCGMGNNGGDGLAVSRMLLKEGYDVQVVVVKYSKTGSPDFQTNLQRLEDMGINILEITSVNDLPEIPSGVIIIDALWGSGLSRPIEGFAGDVISRINATGNMTVALDIPSGLFADKPSEGPIIEAAITITLQLPKLSFMMPESYRYVGEWTSVDIGLSQSFISSIESKYELLSEKAIRSIWRPREKFSHKGSYGHALLISGSLGKMGATVLASRAALRSGAGLLTVNCPASGYDIMQTAVPEAMVIVDDNSHHISSFKSDLSYACIGIGPGIGQHKQTISAFDKLLAEYKQPMIIDADALNILSLHPDWFERLPPGSILTPHPGEFSRLAGSSADSFESLQKQQTFAERYGIILLVKGAHTAIATPEGKVYFNPTGNPGMATAGSGDVLTGILTGLLSSGYTPLETALLGTYLHGLAGDLALRNSSEEALIASDIIHNIPAAFNELTYDSFE